MNRCCLVSLCILLLACKKHPGHFGLWSAGARVWKTQEGYVWPFFVWALQPPSCVGRLARACGAGDVATRTLLIASFTKCRLMKEGLNGVLRKTSQSTAMPVMVTTCSPHSNVTFVLFTTCSIIFPPLIILSMRCKVGLEPNFPALGLYPVEDLFAMRVFIAMLLGPISWTLSTVWNDKKTKSGRGPRACGLWEKTVPNTT
jgi:hypothetical protein